MDLFVVPTLAFNLLYGFIIVRLDRRELVLCVPKTRSGRTGDEVRRGPGVISSYRQAEPDDVQARLCQGTDEFGLRYSSSRRRAADVADAPRHRQ
jgi:hypothetical protein